MQNKNLIILLIFLVNLGMLFSDEIPKNWQPYIQNSEVFTVNKVWPFGTRSQDPSLHPIPPYTFDQVCSFDYIEPIYFSINGYIFKQDSSFKIELGDQFLIDNEEKEVLSGGSYRMHLTLTSILNNQSHRFISEIISPNHYEKIISAVETRREIYDDCWFDVEDRATYCILCCSIEYNVILEDGSLCKVVLNRREKNVHHAIDNFSIHNGDYISFADSAYELKNNGFSDDFPGFDGFGYYKGFSLYHEEKGKMIPYEISSGTEGTNVYNFSNRAGVITTYRSLLKCASESGLYKVLGNKPWCEGQKNNQQVLIEDFGSFEHALKRSFVTKNASNNRYIWSSLYYLGYYQIENKRAYLFLDISNGEIIHTIPFGRPDPFLSF